MANKYTSSAPPDKWILEDFYFNELMSHEEIGWLFSVGRHQIQIWFRKLKIKSRKAYKRFQTGELNHSWKGDFVSYSAFHLRVKIKRGKANRCNVCGCDEKNKMYHWANLTGKYEDVMDYEMMCVSCHHKNDNKINNITKKNPLGCIVRTINQKSKQQCITQ